MKAEMIRLAVEKIKNDRANIRNYNDVDSVLANLDPRIDLLSLDERRDLVVKTAEACAQAGIKISPTGG